VYIEKIAYHLGRRDEVPNQELAKELALSKNIEGIEEIGSYLSSKNKSEASDCLKVLYEIGYIDPELIVDYKDQFIELLSSKNNRMVWGAMIGLSSIAKVKASEIYEHKDLILEKIETGTVITNVWGVYTIINMAANGYYENLKAVLFNLQATCRDVDFAKRAESMIDIFKKEDLEEFIAILENRLPKLSTSAGKRLNKAIKRASLK
jgi:hypothetical protein